MLKSLRTYYFFLFGVNGALFPMLPLVLSLRGLTASEIGWVMMVNPVLGAILPPLWGALADRHRHRDKILLLVSLGSAIAVLLLALPVTVVGSMAAMAVFCVFRSPIASLVDATTYNALGRDRARFGNVRVWGSIGFAVSAVLAGALHASREPTSLLLICSALYLACTLVATGFPSSPPSTAPRKPGLRDTLDYALDPELCPLLITNVLYYGAHAVFDVYFVLHMRSLGRDEGFASLAWGLGVSIEIVVMLFAQRILARFDPGKLLILCGAIAAVRWFGIAEVESPVMILGLQALHGITFGLWYLCLVAHVHEKVPEHVRTSVQGVLLASLAAGTAAGCLVGGGLLETYGSVTAFRAAGVATVLATMMYALRARRIAAAATAPART